ncbi:MAG: two-component sensor histidine kinase [Bdellovibrionales bacterium]|nr:two-component sensor histidine kinase [Bdellovibrionales bacterium]
MNKVAPKKSLRFMLMGWFLLFSIAPLAFLTGYSLVKYEQSLDQELSRRLSAHWREVDTLIKEYQKALMTDGRKLAQEKSLQSYLKLQQINGARDFIRSWMKTHYTHHLWVWDSAGQLQIAFHRNREGVIQRLDKMEVGNVYLSDLKSLQNKDTFLDVDVRAKNENGVVELMVFNTIKTDKGQVIAYLQQLVQLDEYFLQTIKNRLGVELVFFRPEQEKVVSTQVDLFSYPVSFFLTKAKQSPYFDLTLRNETFRFISHQLKWGTALLNMTIGVSKQMSKDVLRKVNVAFFSVVLGIIGLLIVLSVVSSRFLLRPLYAILEGIQNHDLEKELVALEVKNETELGLLASSFNEMAKRTFESKKNLKSKINELEIANQEIKETQAKLVHAAKMASLGQLVAGVAHELNNPIGFIYSNLGVLKENVEKLIVLVDIAEKNPSKLEKAKQEADFDYLVSDVPKLIASCEEGARRTRDIVIGLRNFSRLDEAQLKEVDLHEGLESTLQILSGELKNRITVHKDYGSLPKIYCYASQINQVFMNILSNATQAIEGLGDIFIKTQKVKNNKIKISIRDTGQGINLEHKDKIFDPFFTTKSSGQGTGLGLSISYSVIEKHGGDIEVYSEPGKGTEFIIFLPVKIK